MVEMIDGRLRFYFYHLQPYHPPSHLKSHLPPSSYHSFFYSPATKTFHSSRAYQFSSIDQIEPQYWNLQDASQVREMRW